MGKGLLIFVMGIMVAGGYYAAGSQRAQYETQAELATDAFEILAHNAALMGLDRAEQLLADTFQDYPDVAGTYDGVAYQVSAVTTGSTVVVRSTGTAQTSDGQYVTFDIRAEYRQEQWIPEVPPPFMQNMLTAQGDISFAGNFYVHAYTPLDGSTAPSNANVHTNGTLAVNNSNPTVEGFGTYVVNLLPDQATADGVFAPPDNPSGSDDVYQVAPLDIPPLDPATMASMMTVDSTTAGSVVITAPGDLLFMDGTREDPYVWHIENNLIFDADISIPDYTIFLVNGNLDFNSSATMSPTSYDGNDESTVAYYVGALTRVNGNLEIWGQIFTNSAVISSNGSAQYYGGIVTHASMDLGGGADFYYRQISPALTTFFQGGDNDKLVRLAYSEW